MLDIKATATITTTITQAAKEAIILSALVKRPIELIFNGIDISVDYTSTPEEIVDIYHTRLRSKI